MTQEAISALEKTIRSAIMQGRYAEAQTGVADYCRAVETLLADRTAASPGDAEIAERVLRLLEWARQMTLSGKTHLANELSQLQSLTRYHAGEPGTNVPKWGLEA